MHPKVARRMAATLFGVALMQAAAQRSVVPSMPVYRQRGEPVERRIEDLMRRMTLAEKVRQLDLYSGAKALVDKQTDETHAAPGSVFLPDKALALFGDLGVGGIHDLHATPEQANQIQQWVISHSRLGIPALFIEEALHGYDTGTVFPAPIGLAATWDPQIVRKTSESIAAEARANAVDMILAPVLDL